MKHITLQDGIQYAKTWLAQEMQQRISTETNPDRKDLLTALTARQQSSLECLSLIHSRMDDPLAPQQDIRQAEPWLQALLHPIGGLLMPVLIVTAALLGWKVVTIVLSILALVRAVLVLVFPAKPKKEYLHVVHDPCMDQSELDNFLCNQRSGILADANSILQQFAVATSKNEELAETDLVNLLHSLYEAAADNPDCKDLSYPLSILEARFYRMGLNLVHYAPENEKLFKIINSKGREHERYPAICSRENGLLIHEGQYVKKH